MGVGETDWGRNMGSGRKLGVCLVSTLAAGVIAAASASGAATLTLRTASGTLTAGAPLVAHSSNFKFIASGGGALECDIVNLTGTLTSNGSSTDTMSFSAGSFSGAVEGSPCPTTSRYGPAVVEVLNFPWTVGLGANGRVKVKANRKATFRATFADGAQHGSCVYETSKVAGPFTPAGALVLNATGQPFSLNKKDSFRLCPGSGKLAGEFAFFSSGEVVEAEQ